MEILGIDVGGSGIKGAPINTETGMVLVDRHRIKTPEGAEPQPMAEVIAQIARHFSWQGPIGVGFPGPIKQGVVKMAANISPAWVGLNAGELLGQFTGCPVTVLNDGDAAGLAEVTFGAGKGIKGVVIMVTLGTGIGTAIFCDGKLLPNTEFGHVKIDRHEAEARASDAARQREKLSWKKYAKRLNRYFKEMENLFWPDLFIVGGGISKYHDKYLPLLLLETPVVPAQMFNEAGMIGAALAARLEETKPV